jgi:DNA-binding PadR family transcriptional regulator
MNKNSKKRESLRTPILKLLNEDDSTSYAPSYIHENHFNSENINYINKILDILTIDGFAHKLEKDGAGHSTQDHYVISSKGKEFLDKQKKDNRSFILSLVAIVISFLAIIASLMGEVIKNILS